MQRGQLYALEARIPSLRFPLIARAIASAFTAQAPCTVVVKARPEAYLAQLNTPHRLDLDAAFVSGALGVLVMREDFAKRMFQFGAGRFTRELDGFGVAPGSLVVFEHAGDLLNLRDSALATRQLEALGAWCQERDCTALLVFSGNPERNTVPVTDLLDTMSGLARVEAGRGQLAVDVPYWRCHGRLSSCQHIALRLDSDGHYRTTGLGITGLVAAQAADLAELDVSAFAEEPLPFAPAAPGRDARPSMRTGRSPGNRTPRSFEGRTQATAGLAPLRRAGGSDKATRARFSDATEPA